MIFDFLRLEIGRMRAAGVPVGEDDFRGLHIPDAEVDRILSQFAANPAFESQHADLLERLVGAVDDYLANPSRS